MNRVLIIDLETVPDYNLWTRPIAPEVDATVCEKCASPLPVSVPSGLAEMPKCKAMQRGKCRPAKQPAAPTDAFPPRYAHRVIVAGVLAMGAGEGNEMSLGAATAPEPGDEAGLLQWLAGTFGNFDRIVTWGGTRFDVPVLEMRSLHHGIPQPDLRDQAKKTVDLHDDLAPHWRTPDKVNLDTITRLIGLPGKNGVDGSMVEAMHAAGNIQAIASYCLHDVVQTAYLFLRTGLLRGGLNVQEYKIACQALRAAWAGREDFAGFKVSARTEMV